MDAAEFFQRFADRQEIGRDVTDTHLSVFYDDGREVGLWREDRGTTVGVGSVLSQADAEMARYWFAGNSQEGMISGDGGDATAMESLHRWAVSRETAMKRWRRHKPGDDSQLEIAWGQAQPPAAAAPVSDNPVPAVREEVPPPVQRLKWDFHTTFPQPIREAIDAGVLSEEDAEAENVRALHAAHVREGLFVLHSLDQVLDARRRGVDPETGRPPTTHAGQERLRKLLETEPARLEQWWQTLMGTYEEAFGSEAAEAFAKAMRAWQAGIKVVADDRPTLAVERPVTIAKPPSPERKAIRRGARHCLPVPRPLASAVAAGNFGMEDGKPVRPDAAEIRSITEVHAEKLIDLLDQLRSAPVAGRDRIEADYAAGLAAYADDFGAEAGGRLRSHVEREAQRDRPKRRGRY